MLAIFNSLKNSKRGEEIVEATITIPIILMITFVLIRFTVYYYQIMETRVDMHDQIIEEAFSENNKLVDVVSQKDSVEFFDNTILIDGISYSMSSSYYKYNETDIILAGDLIE
ncbi:MAG TPA: hypothetical protein VJ916_04600 [Anaerovoracaceae bacterium]|nr:hypothetical protein [Anaerovoracaceae bacterium]